MNYIEKMVIKGFKKFENFEINFNKNLNIIVGENEAGKSTILNAIDIVLNQKYKNTDKYIIKEMLNVKNVEKFQLSKNIKDLPKIEIELYMNMDTNMKTLSFAGEKNSTLKDACGIKFVCSFNDEFSEELKDSIETGVIPYEYYDLTWKTFSGETYNVMKKPLSSLIIDNSIIDVNNSFNYYNKMIFNTTHNKMTISKAKDDLRSKVSKVCDELGLNSDDVSFGISEKKVILENIISVLDNGIPLEQMGKGMENLIKTRTAIKKKSDTLDLILIEEPENHLSHTNLRKMISEIQENKNTRQIILTTHNNLIVNKLNLKNVLWVSGNKSLSLSSLEDGEYDKNNELSIVINKNKKFDDAEFFERLPNNNLLQFILSKKVILVEGPTEYVLIPKIYEKIYGNSIDSVDVDIISCEGVTYKRYLNIAKQLNKKVAIITDNDKKQKNIEKFEEFNAKSNNSKIYADTNKDNWTWEVCFYNLNKNILSEIIKVEDDSEYDFNNISYPEDKVLGKMLNNKVDCAMIVLNDMEENDYQTPEYVLEALEWIRN